MATLNWTTYTLIAEKVWHPSSIGGNIYERLYGKVTAQDEANNSTTVSLQWKVGVLYDADGVRDNSKTRSFTAPNMTPAILSRKIDIDAKGKLTQNNNNVTLFTWTAVFTHDADGTYSKDGTMTIPRFEQSGDTAWYTVTGNITLPAINRASTVTATPAIIQKNETITITISAFNDTNKNTTVLSINGTNITLGTNATATGGVITYTRTYAQLEPYLGAFSTSTATVTVTTYNSSDVLLGTNTTEFSVNTGSIPLSLKDNKMNVVGVTIGERATKGGFIELLDAEFGKAEKLVDVNFQYATNSEYFRFQDGETWRPWVNAYYVGAYTGGTARFSIPLPKSVKGITSVTVNQAQLYIRGVDGNIANNEDLTANTVVELPDLTSYDDDKVIRLIVTKAGGQANTPVAVSGYMSFTFNV